MLSIKGIPVTPSEYQRLTAVITMEEQAGWRPTQSDIAELIRSDRHPSKELQQDMKQLDEELMRDE